MRSWSTFKQSVKWGGIVNKPSILADNAINWDEVLSKPSTFSPSTHTHSYLPETGGNPTIFYLWSSRFYRWDVNNNYKNIGSIAGLSTSFGSLIEAPAYGNFAIGIRPNQSNDGFVIVSTDVASDPTSINYSVCKLRILRGQIYLDGSDLNLGLLPSNAAGLPIGTLYKDASGFVKIV